MMLQFYNDPTKEMREKLMMYRRELSRLEEQKSPVKNSSKKLRKLYRISLQRITILWI
jgi:hypothetical protein